MDRAEFPSDTLSTHYIHQPGVASLRRWGLLPEVVRSGCPPIRQQRLDVGPLFLRGAPPPVDGVAESYAVRRTVLDDILLRAAADAGAELRLRFTVDALVTDGGRVTGIRGRAAGGSAPALRGAHGLRAPPQRAGARTIDPRRAIRAAEPNRAGRAPPTGRGCRRDRPMHSCPLRTPRRRDSRGRRRR